MSKAATMDIRRRDVIPKNTSFLLAVAFAFFRFVAMTNRICCIDYRFASTS